MRANQYFPREVIRRERFAPSQTRTWCPWQGTASYFTVRVKGDTNPDAAWYYPEPKDEAAHIRGRVAFWRGVGVEA